MSFHLLFITYTDSCSLLAAILSSSQMTPLRRLFFAASNLTFFQPLGYQTQQTNRHTKQTAANPTNTGAFLVLLHWFSHVAHWILVCHWSLTDIWLFIIVYYYSYYWLIKNPESDISCWLLNLNSWWASCVNTAGEPPKRFVPHGHTDDGQLSRRMQILKCEEEERWLHEDDNQISSKQSTEEILEFPAAPDWC